MRLNVLHYKRNIAKINTRSFCKNHVCKKHMDEIQGRNLNKLFVGGGVTGACDLLF